MDGYFLFVTSNNFINALTNAIAKTSSITSINAVNKSPMCITLPFLRTYVLPKAEVEQPYRPICFYPGQIALTVNHSTAE